MTTQTAQSHEATTTTDHDTIRNWTEERQGRPATVKSTERGDHAGILRIEFPQHSKSHDENLAEIK